MNRYVFSQKVKQVIFAVVLITQAIAGIAQDSTAAVPANEERFRWGIGASAGFIPRRYLLHFQTGLAVTAQKGKHLFSLTPIVGANTTTFSDRYAYEFEGMGGEFCYQYFPGGNTKKTNLYFLGNTSFLMNTIFLDKPKYGYTTVIDGMSFRASCGAGFRWNIKKRFYIYEQNGVGVSYTAESIGNNYVFDDKTSVYPVFQVSVGLGFVFDRKRQVNKEKKIDPAPSSISPAPTHAGNKKFRLGLAVSGSMIYRGDITLFPGIALTLQNSRHLLSLGAVAPAYSYGYYSRRFEFGFPGAEFSYQYYPTGSNRIVSIYLTANTSFFARRYVEKQFGYKGNYYPHEITYMGLKPTAGIGIRVSPSKHFYIFQQNCGGIFFSRTIDRQVGSIYTRYENEFFGVFQPSLGLGFVF